MTLPLSSPFGPVVDQEQQHNHVVNDINNNSNANNFSNSDDIDTFEIFDPRGLFSPATNHHHQALSSDNLIRLKNQTQQHQQQASPASPPSLQSSFAFNDLPPWSIDTPAPAHHHHHHHQTEQPAYKPIDDLTNPNSPQQSSHSFSPPNSTFDLPTVTTTPRMISPVESPISPCSSLPFCRSPPTSLSLNQSGSHMRGRSPPPRFLSDAHSSSSLSSSATSSPSPPQHLDPVIHSAPCHSREKIAAFTHHRPIPIVTSGIRDSSLPSRLSYMRSDDRPDSVTSLAYSEMDSSPAVNFLSAFADATIPSIRTEMSPIQTVPSQVLEEGDQVAGYVIGQIIGRGGFSVVREARHPVTEQRVAVKIVRRSTSVPIPTSPHQNPRPISKPISLHASINCRDRSSSMAMTVNGHLVNSAHLPLPTSATEDLANALLKQEIRVWSNLRSHPNLVPLLSLHETPTQTLLFMPMCEGGNLLQLLNRVKLDPNEQDQLYQIFNWPSFESSSSSPRLGQTDSSASGGLRSDLVRPIFWQIVQGLKYLHTEAGIVHKDIKLENILIQKGQIKISDFGLATYPSPGRPTDMSRIAKGKSSSSWNRDLSLPKTFSALPRINEGRIAGGIDPRSISWSQTYHARSRLPPRLDNSMFSSQPVKEDDDDDSNRHDDDPFCTINTFPTAAGSLAYTPPEQLRSETPLACPSLDIWALGCVLYGLLEGHLPFQDDFEPRLRLKIMNGQFEFPSTLVVNPNETSELDAEHKMMIAKVLKGCLSVDKNARWMIEEIACTPWLEEPRLAKINSGITLMSDDEGQSSSDTPLDDLSMSKRSTSVSSSLASAWSVDELSLNPPRSNDRLSHNPQVSSSVSEEYINDLLINDSCPETICPLQDSPLNETDFVELHTLLTTIPTEPSSSLSPSFDTPTPHPISPLSPQSPPPPHHHLGIERLARSKRRTTSDRHHHHFNRVLPHPVPRASIASQSSSRSRSRNRSPFCPAK
ncbi:hypothetical protein Pst134EB_002193 [Puccinia striiformis f. sp. tritici]|nr:hypothetical protein Pst134EB_002193 [Puccinia striiformis f. sp. tritici]